MFSITISGNSPEEFRGHLAWAYAQFNAGEVIADVATKKAITKARKESATPAPSEPVPSSTAEVTPTSEAVADPLVTVAELQALASAKAKLAGSEKVKECIANHGGKTIKETSPEGRVALKAALEALA